MPAKIIKYYIAFFILSFAFFNVAKASFEITEIMYDVDGTDTGREWIEVENTGATASDLSKWYFFSDNTKHALTPKGVSMIEPGSFAIISQDVNKFKIDWPNFTGPIFDSSWTGLNNEGETIALKDPDLNIVSSVTYTSSMGANGNGDSLQKINGAWIGAKPTVGAVSLSTGGTSGSPTATSTTQLSNTLATIATPKEKEIPKIFADIISNNIAVAGLAFSVKDHTLGYNKELLTRGIFLWNFGDGTTKELKESELFTHIYQYPGEYVLTLSYYEGSYMKEPSATDRVIIKVIPSEISIISVGTEDDPFIEIENKSNIELNLSKWAFRGSTHTFVIPEGTIILPSKKLKFSSKATLFDSSDLSSVVLNNPTGEVMSMYPLVAPRIKYISSNISSKNPISNTQSKKDNSSVINLDDLGASAGNSSKDGSNSFIAWAGLAIIIILGSISVFKIKSRKSDDNIEGEIRAEDMTIIE